MGTLRRRIATMFVLVCLCAASILPLSGCNNTSQERMDMYSKALASYQQESANIGIQVQQFRTVLEQTNRLLADANTNSEQAAKLGKLAGEAVAKIDQGMAYKAKVDAQIPLLQQQIDQLKKDGQSNWGTELAALGAGLTTISPSLPPQASIPATLIGMILTGIGTWWASRKKAQQQQAEQQKQIEAKDAAVTNLVASVQAGLKSLNADQRDQFKDELAKVQDTATKLIVAQAKVPLKIAA